VALLADDTGLGKGCQSCFTVRDQYPLLIVCPAVVRRVWVTELAKWLGIGRDQIALVEPGRKWDPEAPITITSFEMAAKVLPRKWKALIIDEVHYLKNKKTNRAEVVMAHRRACHKDAFVLGLSATPASNEPLDLHGVLDVLEPFCWGSRHDFARRYCLAKDNGYAMGGQEFFGISPQTAPELQERLSSIMVRRSKAEVAHLLPALSLKVVPVEAPKLDLRAMLTEFSREDVHRRQVPQAAISACTDAKLQTSIDLVRDLQVRGEKFIAVMCHYRKTAERLAERLDGVCVHGGDSTPRRHAKIEKIRKAGGGVLCATMHSLTTGISLPEFASAVYAELYWSPEVVTQSMGRFHRVSGNQSIVIYIPILEGTLEERVARQVLRKARDLDLTIGAGMIDSHLIDGLEAMENMDDETFLENLIMTEVDGYG